MKYLAFAVAGCLRRSGRTAAAANAARPPNIVIILADDLATATSVARVRHRHPAPGPRGAKARAHGLVCGALAARVRAALPRGGCRCGADFLRPVPGGAPRLPKDDYLAELTRLRLRHRAWQVASRMDVRSPAAQGFDPLGTPFSNDSNEWPMGAPFIQVMDYRWRSWRATQVEAPVDVAADPALYRTRDGLHPAESIGPFHRHTMPHVPQYAGRSLLANRGRPRRHD